MLKAPPPAFYGHALLKPYAFFDVAGGREQRQAGGGSLRNQACARAPPRAAALTGSALGRAAAAAVSRRAHAWGAAALRCAAGCRHMRAVRALATRAAWLGSLPQDCGRASSALRWRRQLDLVVR